jgi:hypothetical protein
MKNKHAWSVLALCALLAFLAQAAFAQPDVGTIAGFVKDPTGAVVPNAKVTVKNQATGETRTATTNGDGYYTVPTLPPALYTVSVQVTGFKTYSSTDNRLQPNTTLTLNPTLEVGTATESVNVTATAEALQTESGAVQSEVNTTQIQSQELNGRNPLYMAQMLPGVRSGSTFGDFNFAVGAGVPYQINGARSWDTLVTFDGAPAVRTRSNGAVVGVADVDAVQEIQVLTADYSAEYGRSSGGQVRVISKSGTRDFHGSAYEYLRNSDMNANTWRRNLSPTTNFASPFRYNDFGFTVGGPAWIPHVTPNSFRDKFFWFVAEDWIRYRFTDTQTQAVPTTLMRQGNFSELLGSNPWYKAGTVIYNPTTCPTLGGGGCQPFPGNIIPASMLSHNGTAIMSAYPLPTPGFLNGTQNWIAQAAHPIDQRKGTINVDILPTEKHHIAGRRTDASYNEYQPFDQGSGITPKYFIRPNQTNTAEWTYTISPTLINDLRGTFSLDDVYIPVDTTGAGFHRDLFGINYPLLFGGKDIPQKIPTVNVPNFYGLAGGPYPSHSSGPIYTVSDSLTKVWGNHTIKGGYYFEYSGENDGDQINVATVPGGSNNQNGTFTFTDARTGLGATSGVGMANLALGLADSYTEIGPRAYTIWRGPMSEAYIQDSWKVTQKLHLDYGLRFTRIGNFFPLWGNADYFDGNLYNPANAVSVDPKTGNVLLGTGNPYNGVVIPGRSGFPSSAQGRVLAATQPVCDGASCNSLFDPSLPQSYVQPVNLWQPRLGIAYQITPKTVVRGGAGRFVTRQTLFDNIFPGGNSPFQPFVTVANVSVDNPPASLTSGTAAALTMTTPNPNMTPPEAWNWNVEVERELPINSVLTVGYVGRRGLHLPIVYDINQPTQGTLLANPGVNVNYLRPYKGFAEIQEEESVGVSMYNALQVQWNRRMTAGSLFGISYTYSKSNDLGSNYRDIMPDTYYTRNMYGPSEFDTRNVFVANFLYELPFFKAQKHAVGKVLGGWQLSGLVQFQSGTPCGIGTNNDFAGVGEFGSFGCGSEGQFWVLNGPITYPGAFAGPTGASGSPQYANVSVSQPAPGTFNTQSGVRDSVYQPGFQDWNLALFKTFAINERTGFQFRAEAYDFINHPNWGGVNLNPTSNQFLQVNGKNDLARQLQLSLRYYF